MLIESVSVAVKNSNPAVNLGPAGGMAVQGRAPAEPRKSAVEARSADISLEDLGIEIEGLRNVNLNFSVYEATGEIVISVADKDTGEVIREIPPKALQELAAKFQEVAGLILDRKI